MFPPQGGTAGFPGLGPSPGAGQLDGVPPSPTPMSPPPPGVDEGAPFSMRGLAGPGGVPTDGMPPEVLTGITQSAQAMSGLIDSWAQITPDKAAQLSLIQDMLQQYLASLMPAGAGPTSPTAAGPAPPMGGMDRGLAGPGAI